MNLTVPGWTKYTTGARAKRWHWLGPARCVGKFITYRTLCGKTIREEEKYDGEPDETKQLVCLACACELDKERAELLARWQREIRRPHTHKFDANDQFSYCANYVAALMADGARVTLFSWHENDGWTTKHVEYFDAAQVALLLEDKAQGISYR